MNWTRWTRLVLLSYVVFHTSFLIFNRVEIIHVDVLNINIFIICQIQSLNQIWPCSGHQGFPCWRNGTCLVKKSLWLRRCDLQVVRINWLLLLCAHYSMLILFRNIVHELTVNRSKGLRLDHWHLTTQGNQRRKLFFRPALYSGHLWWPEVN